MADKKISDLASNVATASNDLIALVDVSGAVTQKMTLTELAAAVATYLASGAVAGSKIAAGGVTYDRAAAGFAVQRAYALYSAVATGTAIIPHDDTIPQITEGTEFMTLTITPKSATNILVIETVFQGAVSVAGTDIVQALFVDSTANALAANAVLIDTNNGRVNVPMRHVMVAGSTSAMTFRFRAGPHQAATVTMNGFSSNRKLGGITGSSITVTEYNA